MSGPDDIYDGTVAEVRAMTDAPTPREGHDRRCPAYGDVVCTCGYAALTRREPLDVERLRDALVVYGYAPEIADIVAPKLAAEYARQEADDKP